MMKGSSGWDLGGGGVWRTSSSSILQAGRDDILYELGLSI
jgi:hypothetical protein